MHHISLSDEKLFIVSATFPFIFFSNHEELKYPVVSSTYIISAAAMINCAVFRSCFVARSTSARTSDVARRAFLYSECHVLSTCPSVCSYVRVVPRTFHLFISLLCATLFRRKSSSIFLGVCVQWRIQGGNPPMPPIQSDSLVINFEFDIIRKKMHTLWSIDSQEN